MRFNCIEDIKNHQWFSECIKNKTMKSPLYIEKEGYNIEINSESDMKQNYKLIIDDKINKMHSLVKYFLKNFNHQNRNRLS